jgi:HAD superfamily hydrolase (TIGR01509 family)
MKEIKAVIFDCDGVMFDSRRSNIHFYNHLLDHFGLPPMREDQIDFIHMATAVESISHIFRGTPYESEAQAYRFQMDYTPFIDDLAMEPGLKELLELLKHAFRLAVATNRSNTIQTVLHRHGLEDYFDLVVSSLDVTHPKPHPEPLLKVLECFKLNSEEALYVGDSIIDLQTAQAAGVPFIAYKNQTLASLHHVEHHLEIATKLGLRPPQTDSI